MISLGHLEIDGCVGIWLTLTHLVLTSQRCAEDKSTNKKSLCHISVTETFR